MEWRGVADERHCDGRGYITALSLGVSGAFGDEVIGADGHGCPVSPFLSPWGGTALRTCHCCGSASPVPSSAPVRCQQVGSAAVEVGEQLQSAACVY